MPLLTNPAIQNYLRSNNNALPGPLQNLGLLSPNRVALAPSAGTMEAGLPYQLGDMAGSVIEDKQLLKPLGSYLTTLGSNSGLSALLTGLGLGAAGAGYGWLTGRDPLVTGGIGAGAGALGGYGLSELMQYMTRQRQMKHQQRRAEMMKYSYYVLNDQDPVAYIQSKLFADSNMDSATKSRMAIAIQQLPPDQLFSLSNLLQTAAGASVGYLIARFLLNLGGVGQGISAGIGGLVGAMMGRGSSLPRNAFGQEVDTSTDPFGNRRLIS